MGGVEADELVGEGAVVHQHDIVAGVVLTETVAVTTVTMGDTEDKILYVR